MKIHPRYYPVLIIAAFVVFLLIGFLFGFLPGHGGEGHGTGTLMRFICQTLETLG